VIVIFSRDLWILLLSAIALKFTRFRNLQPSVWGKASTFVQIMTAICVIGAHAYDNDGFAKSAAVLIWGVTALAAISAFDYSVRGVAYVRRQR
jgi:phosphatidylglycerophosphate synthase